MTELRPDMTSAHYARGFAHCYSGMHAAARGDFVRFLADDPEGKRGVVAREIVRRIDHGSTADLSRSQLEALVQGRSDCAP